MSRHNLYVVLLLQNERGRCHAGKCSSDDVQKMALHGVSCLKFTSIPIHTTMFGLPHEIRSMMYATV